MFFFPFLLSLGDGVLRAVVDQYKRGHMSQAREGGCQGWMELLEREVLLCVNEVWWSHLESNCCFWLFGLSFVVFISISYLVKDRMLHGSGRR